MLKPFIVDYGVIRCNFAMKKPTYMKTLLFVYVCFALAIPPLGPQFREDRNIPIKILDESATDGHTDHAPTDIPFCATYNALNSTVELGF